MPYLRDKCKDPPKFVLDGIGQHRALLDQSSALASAARIEHAEVVSFIAKVEQEYGEVTHRTQEGART